MYFGYISLVFSCWVTYVHFVWFGFYRMQGGIEAEREERERWINKDLKKMMDSVAGDDQ